MEEVLGVLGVDVSLNGNPLPAGKSFTVSFDVMINASLPATTTEVVNQGTFSGTGQVAGNSQNFSVESTDINNLSVFTTGIPTPTITLVVPQVPTTPTNPCLTSNGLLDHLPEEPIHDLYCRWR